MTSPSNVKQVQQLKGCLVDLYCFLSYASNNVSHFFVSLKKKEKFEWTSKCKEEFFNLKVFLESSPNLTCPIVGSPLYLYLSIIDQKMNYVIVQEINKVDHPVYYISKLFKDVEAQYQNIMRLALEFLITARNSNPSFKGIMQW